MLELHCCTLQKIFKVCLFKEAIKNYSHQHFKVVRVWDPESIEIFISKSSSREWKDPIPIDGAYNKIYLKYTFSNPGRFLSFGEWIEMVNLREAFSEKGKKHCQRLSYDCGHLNTSENIVITWKLPQKIENILRKTKTLENLS